MEFSNINELKKLRTAVLKQAYKLKVFPKGYRLHFNMSKNHSDIKNLTAAINDETKKQIGIGVIWKFITNEADLTYHKGGVDILVEFARYKGTFANYKSTMVLASEYYKNGLKLEKKPDMRAAIAAYKKANELQPGELNYLIKYGMLLTEFGNTDKANILLNKARDIAQRTRQQDKKVYYEILLAYGSVVYNMELPKDATIIYKEAIDLGTQIFGKLDTPLLSAYNLAAHASLATSALSDAIEFNTLAFKILEKNPAYTSEEVAIAYKIKGMIANAAGHLEEALALFRKALSVYEKPLATSLRKSDVYTCIGVVEQILKNNVLALKSYENAKALDQKLWGAEHRTTMAHCLRIASTLSRMGKASEAKQNLSEALQLAEKFLKTKNLILPAIYNNRGLINWKSGREDEAIEDWKKAQELGWELYPQGREGLARIHTNLGLYYTLSSNSNFEDAEDNFKRALNIMKDIYKENNWEYGTLFTRWSRLHFEKAQKATGRSQRNKEKGLGLSYADRAISILKAALKNSENEWVREAEENKRLLQGV